MSEDQFIHAFILAGCLLLCLAFWLADSAPGQAIDSAVGEALFIKGASMAHAIGAFVERYGGGIASAMIIAVYALGRARVR